MIVDRILDFKMRADEPPAAAQFLCSKLYNEFAFLPEIEDGNMASSMGFAPDVVECAEHLYGVFLVLALHAPPRCTQAMLSFSSLSRSLSLSTPPSQTVLYIPEPSLCGPSLSHIHTSHARTDHNCDVTFALDFIFRDKIHFRDTLGKKKRWPVQCSTFASHASRAAMPPTPYHTLPYPTIPYDT